MALCWVFQVFFLAPGKLKMPLAGLVWLLLAAVPAAPRPPARSLCHWATGCLHRVLLSGCWHMTPGTQTQHTTLVVLYELVS